VEKNKDLDPNICQQQIGRIQWLGTILFNIAYQTTNGWCQCWAWRMVGFGKNLVQRGDL